MLTTTTQHALRALIHIARMPEGQPVDGERARLATGAHEHQLLRGCIPLGAMLALPA